METDANDLVLLEAKALLEARVQERHPEFSAAQIADTVASLIGRWAIAGAFLHPLGVRVEIAVPPPEVPIGRGGFVAFCLDCGAEIPLPNPGEPCDPEVWAFCPRGCRQSAIGPN